MNDELIALSVLSLDLPAHDGWTLDLAGVTVVADDVGRRSVSRDDARRLITEHRASEARAQERLRLHREETERKAIEQDERFRAQLHPGLPASLFAPGEDPIRVQIAAELAADPRRRSVREELMDAQFGRSADDEKVYTYYPIQRDGDE